MFVINIKRCYDSAGVKIKEPFKPFDGYFGYDRYAGSFSTGLPTWLCSIKYAEQFNTAEEAKKAYLENLSIMSCNWKVYDKNSIKICEVKVEPVEPLPWKLRGKNG